MQRISRSSLRATRAAARAAARLVSRPAARGVACGALRVATSLILLSGASFAQAPAESEMERESERVRVVAGAERSADSPLRTAYHEWAPFLHVEEVDGITTWSGLDLELVELILDEAGLEPVYLEVRPWDVLLADLAAGELDFAIGAYRTAERERFGRYSKPYRHGLISLYVRRGELASFAHDGVADLLRTIRQRGARLGLVRGWSYTEAIDAEIARPENRPYLVYVEREDELVPLLLSGRIDLYLSGLVAGQTFLWERGLQDRVEHDPEPLARSSVHVLFGRRTTTPEHVVRFDRALETMKSSGEYDRVIRAYYLPIILALTLETQWFFVIDIIGTIAFSLSGIVIGRREGYSLFGTLLLAALPAVGGGVIRDLFVGRHPLGVLRTPTYVKCVLVTVLASWALLRLRDLWRRRAGAERLPGALSKALSSDRVLRHLVQIFDSLGLAAFTIIGVVVALEARSEPLWVWGPFFGMLTGAGGGIVRDVVRSDPEIAVLKSEFYAEVAILWGFVFSLYLMLTTERLNPDETFLAVLVVLFGGLATRMLAYHLGWRSPRF